MDVGKISKIGNYKFELIPSSAVFTGPQKPDPFLYLSIRDNIGTPLASTLHTHRFESVPEAELFALDVANGKYSIQQLQSEEKQMLLKLWNEKKMNTILPKFTEFMLTMQSMGLSPETVQAVAAAYNQLPAESKKLLHDEKAIEQFKTEHPMPEKQKNPITFGDWIEVTQKDIDVCLVDADTGEHYLDAVCYLPAWETGESDLEYSALEKWLFTLPVDRVTNLGGGADLMLLRTDFSLDQTNFLLGDSGYGFDSQKWVDLFDRANLADADFESRLAYLKDGTPFEVPFDGNTMDAVFADDRKELCQFLEKYPNAFVAPSKDDFLVVYSVMEPKHIVGIRSVDCNVCAQHTEPGKGLSSTLEGKLALAKQKTNQEHSPLIPEPQR